MVDLIKLQKLIDQVDPFVIIQYLECTGWHKYNLPKKKVAVYQYQSDKKFYQVNIPLKKSLSDYREAWLQVIKQVAQKEEKPCEEVLLNLSNPNVDVLKIRVQRKSVKNGSILIKDAINMLENTKKLVLSTVEDVLHPKKIHLGRTDKIATQFIDNCRIGQTEVGSYIISVVFPFGELKKDHNYEELSIFSSKELCASSLTRQVTMKLMNNLSFIKKHMDDIHFDYLSEKNEQHISINFYEALNNLSTDEEGSELDFSANWAPVTKQKREKTSVSFFSSDYQIIKEVVHHFKEKQAQIKRQVIYGKIIRLASVPNLEDRTEGKITVTYIDKQNTQRQITVSLGKDDYTSAIEAHKNGEHVKLLLDESKTRQGNNNNVLDFKVLKEETFF